jgi:hypothetical protein
MDRMKKAKLVVDSIFETWQEICGRSFLNVGFSSQIPSQGIEHKKWWYELFKSKGFTDFALLEVFPKNVEFSKEYFSKRNISMKVVEGNVLDSPKFFQKDEFDVSMFWHGPEHLEEKKIDVALRGLEYITRRYLIIGCPNGQSKQDTIYGNPYEEHISGPNEKFFKSRGYVTKVVARGSTISHLTAVKVLGE